MDQATIRQMVQEWKQANDKADFLASELERIVIENQESIVVDGVLIGYRTDEDGNPIAYIRRTQEMR